MSYIGNQPTNVAFVTDTFTGNGSTTAFTMSVAPASTTSVLVAITGVLQDPSTYSVSGTTLTFSAAPPAGTNNISVRYLGIPASGVTTTAYRTVTNFTATAGQTTFTPPSYTAGYIDVYRNGSRLNSADYTASTGTTVVLAAGCNAGDSVTTESFYVSSVLNAIPATAGAVNSTYIAAGAVGPVALTGNAPQVTVLTSGSGTYTTPSYCKALYIRMVGGGSSGGTYAADPAVGGATTFGASLTCNGGGTASGGDPPPGGTATGGDINITGAYGQSSNNNTTQSAGSGGSSPFGGAGGGGRNGYAGYNAAANSGSGGGGGAVTSSIGRAGGAAGGYLEKTITSPAATYAYTVGAGGSGVSNAGNGGSGVIIVTAYF